MAVRPTTRRRPTRILEPLRRIRWQLPLSIVGLLVVVVAVHSWIGYREVRRTTLVAAGDRLRLVAGQLNVLLSPAANQLRIAARERANDSSLVEAIGRGLPIPDRTRARFERVFDSSVALQRIVVRNPSGDALLDVRRPEAESTPVDRVVPNWLGDETSAVSDFYSGGNGAWFDVAAAIEPTDQTVGYVVQSLRLSIARERIEELAAWIGRDLTILVGTPGGTWTDLVGIVEGPPVSAQGELPGEYRVAERGWRVGVGLPVTGTPWEVWVEFPRHDVLDRLTTFLTRVLPVGSLVVFLGALGSWVLSRHVTGGLGELTTAATAMAKGDYERRVEVQRRDELGDLAEAFNVMAGRVEDAQQGLEQRVKERTAELLASQEQFSAIATNAYEAIITADATGSIQYFNPGAERIFGYSADDIRGQPLTTLMPERYQRLHERGFATFLETGRSAVIDRTLEVSGLRRDGSEFPIELSLASWQQHGEPAFGAILRDVTTRREAEDELQRYASELQAVNQELEAFSYSVSHDLRAPLRAIHGFSQALLEDYRDRLDEEGVDYLGRVCAAVDRMGHLIDDLLQLAQTTRASMRREEIDLGALARTITKDLQAMAPERQAQFSIANGLRVTGDGRLLRLAIENLLGNAWKFTAKVERAEIAIGLGVVNGGGRALFVRDNGAGFDMTYADKMFHPFQRLHAPKDFPGTGIGLAIVQRIIHRHGGTIWAESSPGSGATFYFTMAGL